MCPQKHYGMDQEYLEARLRGIYFFIKYLEYEHKQKDKLVIAFRRLVDEVLPLVQRKGPVSDNGIPETMRRLNRGEYSTRNKDSFYTFQQEIINDLEEIIRRVPPHTEIEFRNEFKYNYEDVKHGNPWATSNLRLYVDWPIKIEKHFQGLSCSHLFCDNQDKKSVVVMINSDGASLVPYDFDFSGCCCDEFAKTARKVLFESHYDEGGT